MNREFVLKVFLLLFATGIIVSVIFSLITQQPAPVTERSISSFHFTKIWTKPGVVLHPQTNDSRVFLTIESNCVLLIDNRNLLKCLNVTSGDTMWQAPIRRFGTGVTNNESTIFIPSSLRGVRDEHCADFTPQCERIEVTAYDVSTGQIRWSKVYDGMRVVLQISADETLLEVVGSGGHGTYFADMTIDARTGSLLSYEELDVTHTIQLLQGMPEFLKEREDIVSNLAAMDSTLYFLTDDGMLWAVNDATGAVLGGASFQSPFSAYDQYQIAARHGVVVVYLGDSRQLFTLWVTP